MTVSFYDFSDQLQETHNDSPIPHDFPEAIDPLEFDVQAVLDVIDSEHSTEGQASKRTITAVHFASQTQECAIALNTGELLVYHPKNVRGVQRSKEEVHDPELQLLTNITVEPWRKLAPYFALSRIEGGTIVSIAISEIGKLTCLHSKNFMWFTPVKVLLPQLILMVLCTLSTCEGPPYSIDLRDWDEGLQGHPSIHSVSVVSWIPVLKST